MFLSTLNQIGYLFLLIALGFIIMKACKMPSDATKTLSKLESFIFMPALIISNFAANFTTKRLGSLWQYFVLGVVVIVISIALAYLIAHFPAKDDYHRRIHIYSLAFSNFGFMGTAVVSAVYPELFTEYLVFASALWIFNYGWAIPTLLIPKEDKTKGIKATLKNFLNPMFIAMFIGIMIGLIGIKLPTFISASVGALSDCMSPVAMLITGMTVATIDLKKTLKSKSIYLLTVISVILVPLAFIGISMLTPLDYSLELIALCALSMPLGLNSVVIPAAYGKDTSDAAGMAIVSHLLSALTIPLMLVIFTNLQ